MAMIPNAHMGYWQRRKRAASERGRRMAAARWKRDRERRQHLAETEPLAQCMAGRVLLQRVIVIQRDQTAVELCRWSDTSQREWARLKRSADL